MSFKFTQVDNFDALEDSIKEHVPRIIENRVKEFHQAKSLFSDNNIEEICKYCHKVEGIAACYGLFQLDEIIRYIHKLAKDANSEEIAKVLPVLESYLNNLN